MSEPAGEARASTSKTILSYSSAILFCRFVAIVQGLVLIRLMEPGVLGVWLGLQLISIYGVHAHFGLINAVNRQIPFHAGRDERPRAEKIERVARGNLLLLSAAGLVAVAILYLLGLGGPRRGALFLLVATIVNLNVHFYLGLFRARHQFGKASIVNVANALAVLFGLPLIYFYEFDGLLWRAVAAVVVAMLACIALDGWSYRVEFDRKETLSLIRIGLPIMILGLGVVAFSSMDRTLIVTLLDDEAMGQYAICFAVAKIMALFPITIGQIFYPQMTELYAAQGMSRKLVNRCVQASLLSAGIVGAMCAASYAVLPWLVETVFPRYVPGLPALKVALVAYLLLALTAGPNYFLISTVQKRRQFGVLLAAAAVMIGCAMLLADRGLIGIAWALVIGSAIYVAGLWMIVMLSTRRVRAETA